jgi:cyclophilin family peptidyl-prolyl cis-trans isomerase
MKKILLAAVSLLTVVFPVLADDVAVVSLKISGEKKPQQFVIEFYEGDAPQTVENFKKLAHHGFYKGIAFHRVFPKILVQTGDPLSRNRSREKVGTGGPGYTLPAEIHRKHIAGAVVMGRLPDKVNPARRSNGSQFFVTLKPMPEYDGQYTVFGHVVSGLDVLEAVSRKPADSNDNPVERVVIRSVKIMPCEKAGV